MAATQHAAHREAPALTPGSLLQSDRVSTLLMDWRASEIKLAKSFAEVRGLSEASIEDLYQETVLALLHRPFLSNEHLRNALRWGVKRRALQSHRDTRRHDARTEQDAREAQTLSDQFEQDTNPEAATLLHEDRLVVWEFLCGLDTEEREAFWLMTEGMSYTAIATAKGITPGQARRVYRSCERKREVFQLLYEKGRLCGYRAQTIEAMIAGEQTSDQLAEQAIAHVERCAQCRAQHATSAQRLRRSFARQAAAVLPIPALAGHAWLLRLNLRTKSVLYRLLPGGSAIATDTVRERATLLANSGPAGGQIIRATTALAVIAAGAIGGTHALEQQHHTSAHHTHRPARGAVSGSVSRRPLVLDESLPIALTRTSASQLAGAPAHRSAGHQPSGRRRAARAAESKTDAFPELGIPQPAARTSVPTPAVATEHERGGPFSP
jgi:RNA polymerase sigma factor (sigma-70 family)